MSSDSGSIHPAISSWQGFLFGLRRHETLYSGGYSGSGKEAIIIIAAKYSPNAFAWEGSDINSPSSSRKWVMSVIQVSAILQIPDKLKHAFVRPQPGTSGGQRPVIQPACRDNGINLKNVIVIRDEMIEVAA